MKKPSIIIRKNHIILACLTLILGIAVYLSYAIGQEGIDADPVSGMSGQELRGEGDDLPSYGDAAFVNGEPEVENDYFAEARLERTISRDEAVETLSTLIGGGDLTEEELAVMKSEAIEVSKLVESESKVESLIKAQGFNDCIVYLDGETANIVVKTEGLIPAEAAQIKSILLSEVSVPAENIRIFEVK